MKEIFKRAISHNISFWICLAIAIFLMIGGALTPPYFIIDSSIFVATGELWLFAALGSAVRAIDKGQNAKIQRGDTTVTIGDTEEENE